MSETKKATASIGLGDTNVDTDILTKEIDHNFFDDPVQASMNGKHEEEANANKLPNKHECVAIEKRLGEDDSGRSSSNITVHLELGETKDGDHPSDFYSMQSNANYPRPKESYQLQQRRRSFGTIQQPTRNSFNHSNSKGEESNFAPMNPTDCGLNGHFEAISSSDSGSSKGDRVIPGADEDESDSDLSDSSESELESLASDDEDVVDMLEKYFDYIDADSDCSDLTEVSPMSSLAPSPLLRYNEEKVLCDATDGLKIDDSWETEISNGTEGDVAMAAITAVASAVPTAAQFLERELRNGKPRLPRVISTMETIIVPVEKEDESDDDNGGTCGTSGEEEDEELKALVEDECAEPDPGKDKEVHDVCFNCCVLEHAKKILSREASPSRNKWALRAEEERNGNPKPDGEDKEKQLKPRDSWKPRASSSTSGTSSSGTSSGCGGSSSSGGAKRAQKNFTFTPEQMRKIERENHILLRKILDTHQKGHHHHKCKHNGHHHHSSTSVVRLRQQKRIEHENAILMKKLQNIKPSKEIGEAFSKPVKNN